MAFGNLTKSDDLISHDVELRGLSRQTVEEGVKRLPEGGMLELALLYKMRKTNQLTSSLGVHSFQDNKKCTGERGTNIIEKLNISFSL